MQTTIRNKIPPKTCYKQTYKQKWVRKNYKILKQMQETTLVYLLFNGIGPQFLGLKKHLSLGWGSYGSMEMDERECGWLERQRVSSNP